MKKSAADFVRNIQFCKMVAESSFFFFVQNSLIVTCTNLVSIDWMTFYAFA